MTVNAYFIQCITNLHVGSGDANYGIVDKLVQRDTVFNYPTIHASSLKGSLREHFERIWEKDDNNRINKIFGKKTNADSEAESGNLNFLNADLVALPVRCSHKQFALTLCPKSIAFVNEKSKMLVGKELLIKYDSDKIDKLFTDDTVTKIYMEDDDLKQEEHSSPFQKGISINDFTAFENQFAIVDDAKFDNYTENLPVIARNHLNKDKNLWYEEVVPHQTIFVTFFIPKPDLDTETFSAFETILLEKPVQIGANSSVGYGLCKFHKITF